MAQDIQIVGGEYYRNAREGIFVKMADDVTITGASIYENMREGVKIDGATDTIARDSMIFNNSQAGHNLYDQINIVLRADTTTGDTYYALRTQILNNSIYSNGAIDARWGVREASTNDDGGPSGTIVSNNTISGMATGAISIPGGSGTDYPMDAVNDTYSANEDAVLTVGAAQGVLANDTALNGGKAVVEGQFTTANGGTLVLKKDGSFVYTPKTDFFGSDSFTYTAFDADGDTDTATVTLNVKDVPETPTDHPMVVANDTYSATEDMALSVSAAQGVLANDTALNGGKSAVAGQFTTVKGGTVRLNADGSFTYTPKTDFFGSDSFTYTAFDADGDQAQGTVTLNVKDVAEPNPTPFPSIGAGTTQLEQMALKNFTSVSLNTAQGGKAVENRIKDVEATAKGTFTGESGTYKVKLAYYDENDGASLLGIRVNGVTVKSWTADKQLGSSVADSKTLTFYEADLQLTTGAAVEIYGTRKGDDLVRIDTLTLTQWQLFA